MPLHARPKGGLRLAYADLPPTLQPHAILSVAPRPDRRISALAATVIYLGLAAGIVLLGRPGAAIRIGPGRGNETVWEFPPEPKPSPATLPDPPARQAAATAAPLPDTPPIIDDSDVPPEETPTRIPQNDRSRDNARPATDQELNDGKVLSPPAADVKRGTSTGGIQGTGTIPDFSARPPRVLLAVNPSYPALARISQLQGPVELLITIDEHGVPALVQVLSGHVAFHAEAERAARLWRFEPATLEGRPVPARFRLTISFRLK